MKTFDPGGCLPLSWVYIHVYDHYFQISSSLKPPGQSKSNFMRSLRRNRGRGGGGGNIYIKNGLILKLVLEHRGLEFYKVYINDYLKGVLTPTLQPVCNWFATRKKLKSQSGCKGRGKVFFKSPTSRRLKSVASCLLNMHKRLAATEFDREGVA